MESVKFEELGLYPQLLRAIKEMGFEEATPIQAQAIPVVMSGVDVIGQAQTGTGKTASFGIPLLMKVDPNNKKTQAIVLSPTRELAIQSAEEIRKLAKYMHGIKVLPVYGGQDIGRQIKALKGGATIIIGTPGRIMDHLRRKTIRCDHVNTIVLDEADEMLNMGFREDIETILSYITNEDRQTVLFSATMPKPILDITKKYQKNATTIKVTKKELTVPNIDQYYYDVRRNDKVDVLTRLLDYYNPKLSLVFCNTKRMVDDLADPAAHQIMERTGLQQDVTDISDTSRGETDTHVVEVVDVVLQVLFRKVTRHAGEIVQHTLPVDVAHFREFQQRGDVSVDFQKHDVRKAQRAVRHHTLELHTQTFRLVADFHQVAAPVDSRLRRAEHQFRTLARRRSGPGSGEAHHGVQNSAAQR